MITILNTLLGIGTLTLAALTLVSIVLYVTNHQYIPTISKYSSTILRVILVGSVIGSLLYELVFGYTPCLLCWYQRMTLFPLAILVFTTTITQSRLLQKQVFIFSGIGLLFALFHNVIDIFPGAGPDVCGTGPSCLLRYVDVFGFVTIPFMSAVVLISVITFTLFARRYPQTSIV